MKNPYEIRKRLDDILNAAATYAFEQLGQDVQRLILVSGHDYVRSLPAYAEFLHINAEELAKAARDVNNLELCRNCSDPLSCSAGVAAKPVVSRRRELEDQLLTATLVRVSEDDAEFLAKRTEILKEIAEIDEAERASREAFRDRIKKNVEGDHKRRLAYQADCAHLKENGKTRLIGARTSDGVTHLICNLCMKHWLWDDAPAGLRPSPEAVGDFQLGTYGKNGR